VRPLGIRHHQLSHPKRNREARGSLP
jgi:hypothetical protein